LREGPSAGNVGHEKSALCERREVREGKTVCEKSARRLAQ